MAAEATTSRRQLFRAAGRAAAAGGLATLTALFALRRQASPGAAPPACGDGCRGCRLLARCCRPEARAARQAPER
ncbi:MAG: hypothetical protein ACLF0G_09140 [Candidatus Brocadiia bacterium]